MSAVRVQTWRLAAGLPPMRIVMVADLHACWPWMPPGRIRRIIDQAQALGGDLIALMGDYPAHMPVMRRVEPRAVVAELARLRAPMGVWAVFGNHDWWDDCEARQRGAGPMLWQTLFAEAGIPMLNNRGLKMERAGTAFGLAGIDSQRAFRAVKSLAHDGLDDLDRALDGLGDLPVLLLAHEPDIFARMRAPVRLQLSGHTHGGQIRPFGRPYVVPSEFGARYAYGLIEEEGRHLIVSGGLGCTTLPFRWGMPPELTVVELV